MSAGDSGLFKPTLEEKSGQLQGKPGRDTLHAIALDVAAIPHGEGNRDRHARLELHIVRIIGRQGALDDDAPSRSYAATTLDRSGWLPQTVSNHILMGLGRQRAEAVGIQILDGADAQGRVRHDVA